MMKRVVYVYDDNLAKCTDNIPHITGRSKMVHELITAYGLTKLMDCKDSKLATKEDLLKFHSQDYVDFLFQGKWCNNDTDVTDDDEGEEHEEQHSKSSCSETNNYGISNDSFNQGNLEEYGLGYDCPTFKNIGDFALKIAGATLTAADALVQGADIAINWCGGWHHAQRGEASGFCYVNDIVLGIHELQKKFKYVLYVDLDAHHGDGVENAFIFSDKVMTLSFHHYETGYFPGTGQLTDVGTGRGKFYSLNVPLKMGVTDAQFVFVFDSIFSTIVKYFQPDAFVVQCGADCLAKDPLGAFNLTERSVTHCIDKILEFGIPTLLLGGGGYNISNAARLWTNLTSQVLKQTLNNEIPDNPHFLKYGPDFELSVAPSLRKNENDAEFISDVIRSIIGHIISLRQRKAQGCQVFK